MSAQSVGAWVQCLHSRLACGFSVCTVGWRVGSAVSAHSVGMWVQCLPIRLARGFSVCTVGWRVGSVSAQSVGVWVQCLKINESNQTAFVKWPYY